MDCSLVDSMWNVNWTIHGFCEHFGGLFLSKPTVSKPAQVGRPIGPNSVDFRIAITFDPYVRICNSTYRWKALEVYNPLLLYLFDLMIGDG